MSVESIEIEANFSLQLGKYLASCAKQLATLIKYLATWKDYLLNVRYFIKCFQEMLSTAALSSFFDVILCVNTIVDSIDKNNYNVNVNLNLDNLIIRMEGYDD